MTEQILPVLPAKISGQSEPELTHRQQELEEYMGQVLNLMSGQAQFNEALLSFVGAVPRGLGGLANRGAESSPGKEKNGRSAVTDIYYDTIECCFDKDRTRVDIKSHGIRLDQHQKPKNFYLLEVSFNDASKLHGQSSKGARPR